jgi:hypothetical protein
VKLARAARPRPGSAPSGPLVLAEAGALTRPPAVGSSCQQPLAPAQRAPGGRATATVALAVLGARLAERAGSGWEMQLGRRAGTLSG